MRQMAQRICDKLDEGVYLNKTLDGPAVNKDGSLADQSKIRLEVHQGMVKREQCHIYKSKKYCYCGRHCIPWDQAVLEHIERIENEKEEGTGEYKYPLVHKILNT